MHPGLKIAVVAPAGIHDPQRLETSLALIRSWGHSPLLGRHTAARHRYTAGTRAQRAADLRWALTAPGIDAVWFTRGGYGTAQLLPEMPLDEVDDRLVIGFSDATVLLWALAQRGRGRPVHGPVLHSLADHVDDRSRAAVRSRLGGGRARRMAGRLLTGPAVAVEGPLLGGNLCMLASLCGTPWAFRGEGAIVLLEEVGEAPYRLDRLLTQLVQSGALAGVRGVALGQFMGTHFPADADWGIEELFIELLGPLGVPVVTDLPVGHGARNIAWDVGAAARLHPGGLDVVPD